MSNFLIRKLIGQVIDDRQNMITEKKKELVKEITEMVLKITNTVNIRGKQLVLRLNEVCDSKLKVLNEKKDALQLLSGHTDHCIDFVQSALDNGSDSAVLFSKKTLSRHLQKVKCQRADIPNPEIPVRIQVQLTQVQELQKVISQLGTIIVDGKAYPPTASPGAPRQQPSPNMIPPVMRPGMHQPANIQPAMNVVQQPGFHSSPPMYNATPPQPQQFNIQINRPFSQDANNAFGKWLLMRH